MCGNHGKFVNRKWYIQSQIWDFGYGIQGGLERWDTRAGTSCLSKGYPQICCWWPFNLSFFLSTELRGTWGPSFKLLSPAFQPSPLFLWSPGREQSWCRGQLLSQKPRCTAKGRHLGRGLNWGLALPLLSLWPLFSKCWGSKAERNYILDRNKSTWKGQKWMYR